MMKYTLVLGLMAACEAFVALPDARIRSPARFGRLAEGPSRTVLARADALLPSSPAASVS
eukprot:scaffold462_cov195-Pinguiococcus_pyrenoidosus.AAC.79